MAKYIITALLVVISLISTVGYLYYKNAQEQIELLQTNNIKLELAAQTNKQTIDSLEQENKNNQQRISNLGKNLKDAQQYNTELRQLFQKHNLTLLAEEKPGLIEKRINEATNEIFTTIMRSTSPR